MLKLFIYKEKYNILNNIIYVLMLVIFSAMVIAGEADKEPIFVLFWFTFMTETLRYSVFDLAPHLSKGLDYKAFKANATHLDTNLKLLSIEPLNFIKYNMVYTLLRLLPFWLVIIIFNGHSMIFILTIFTLTYIYKSIIGPLHSFPASYLRDISLNQTDLTFREKNKYFFKTISKVNPLYKTKEFKMFYKFFTYGAFGILFWFYTYVFLDTFNYDWFSPFHPIWITALILGFIMVTIYGVYLIDKERRLYNEIH